MANSNEEMLVIAFPGEQRAAEVLQALRQLSQDHLVDLHKAAILVRHADGKVEIQQNREVTTKEGLLGGALVGGLLGHFGHETLEGALMGAGAGFLASKVLDSGIIGFQDDYLKQVGDALTPGTSAVVASIQFEHVDQALQTLSQFHDGRIIRQSLPADVAAKVQAALQG